MTVLGISVVNSGTAGQLALLGIAFVLAAIVGIDRQRRLKSAGLRTHTLVGTGAAAFALASSYGFSGVLGAHVVLDPSRVAAQVVSGIGFLGAGVIFVKRGSVNGLTTAASIWVTAAIGLACGAGLPVLALATTVLYLICVLALAPVGRRISESAQHNVFLIEYIDGGGVLREVLRSATELGFSSTLESTRLIDGSGGPRRVQARITFRGGGSHADLVAGLSSLSGVTAVQVGDGRIHRPDPYEEADEDPDDLD